MSENRPENLSAPDAHARLCEGNTRYVDDRPERPHGDAARRSGLTAGQQPFATILACADSRVAPELVFDQGLGDLFVVRVAGNIVDDVVLGSIEYASAHLGVNLIVVMGHASCGAVGAAVENVDVDGPATHSHIDSLIEALRPAVKAAREAGSGDLVAASVNENACRTAASIRSSEPIIGPLASSSIEVKPACYDLATGRIDWLD